MDAGEWLAFVLHDTFRLRAPPVMAALHAYGASSCMTPSPITHGWYATYA